MPIQVIDWVLNTAIPHGGEIFTVGKKKKENNGGCHNWNNTRHKQQQGGKKIRQIQIILIVPPTPAVIRIIKVLRLNARVHFSGLDKSVHQIVECVK